MVSLKNNPLSFAICGVVGIAVGIWGGPVIVLIPWAAIGLAIGWLCVNNKAALINGAVYGFALAYTFMVVGYNGTDPLSHKLLPFVIFGVIGSIAGLVLTSIGKLSHRSKPQSE